MAGARRTIPATSQLDRLISITAISVPSGLRGVRDRLRSFNFCIGLLSIGSLNVDGCNILADARPIASPLEVCVRRPHRARRTTFMGPASANLHNSDTVRISQ